MFGKDLCYHCLSSIQEVASEKARVFHLLTESKQVFWAYKPGVKLQNTSQNRAHFSLLSAVTTIKPELGTVKYADFKQVGFQK